METVGWHEKIKRQLDVVQQWRQSGKSIAQWAAAHGVDAKLLMGWVTYEKRWRQRLAAGSGPSDQSRSADPAASKAMLKTTAPAPTPERPNGFVAAQRIDVQAQGSVTRSAVANKANDCALGPASVRMQCAGLVLHWPVTQTQELAALLKLLSSPGNASTNASTQGRTPL
ncbi:MAG: hypothetical protein ACK528_03020 [Alphaproteobacteria bacterium]|jgi:transposase-like protein